jgi:hypothetical protein
VLDHYIWVSGGKVTKIDLRRGVSKEREDRDPANSLARLEALD